MAPKAWGITQAFVFCVKVGRGVASADRAAHHKSFVMRAAFRTVQSWECAPARLGFCAQHVVDLRFGRQPIFELSSWFEVATLRAKVRSYCNHLLPLFSARQAHRHLAASFCFLIRPVVLHTPPAQHSLAAL
jgi:hypothetical protein